MLLLTVKKSNGESDLMRFNFSGVILIKVKSHKLQHHFSLIIIIIFVFLKKALMVL